MLANSAALDICNLHPHPGRSAHLRAERAEQGLVSELALAGRRYRAHECGSNVSTRTSKPSANTRPSKDLAVGSSGRRSTPKESGLARMVGSADGLGSGGDLQ